MKPLVAVFAHPDDESFGPGGTLALLARQRDVYVICVTNGDAGQQHSSTEGDLSVLRPNELKRAARILGVKDVFFLGYRDGSLSNSMYHDIAAEVQRKLEELQPEILLTFEPRGVSGHIDHIAVSMISSFVFEKLKNIRQIWYYCLNKKFQEQREKYFIFFPVGYDEKEIDMVIDIDSVWDVKVQAMREHKTQLDDVERILRKHEKFPKKEYFLVRTK